MRGQPLPGWLGVNPHNKRLLLSYVNTVKIANHVARSSSVVDVRYPGIISKQPCGIVQTSDEGPSQAKMVETKMCSNWIQYCKLTKTGTWCFRWSHVFSMSDLASQSQSQCFLSCHHQKASHTNRLGPDIQETSAFAYAASLFFQERILDGAPRRWLLHWLCKSSVLFRSQTRLKAGFWIALRKLKAYL